MATRPGEVFVPGSFAQALDTFGHIGIKNEKMNTSGHKYIYLGEGDLQEEIETACRNA
jgi:hypothetical protein